MAEPETLTREISLLPKSRQRRKHVSSNVTSPLSKLDDTENAPISPAAIEAGKAEVSDHLAHFTAHLATKSRPEPAAPRISIQDFEQLYRGNQLATGHHFVIHQHNHPIADVHCKLSHLSPYLSSQQTPTSSPVPDDLRLQISASSTLSFALPYGLPGNPNSKRPGRMAIETRVHNLWVRPPHVPVLPKTASPLR